MIIRTRPGTYRDSFTNVRGATTLVFTSEEENVEEEKIDVEKEVYMKLRKNAGVARWSGMN